MLKVGPESAGADPGPACYGKGGTRATLTDAFAVLGFVGQVDLGYETVQIDADRARTAVETLATPLSMPVEQAAESMVRIAISGMYLEVSKLMSAYGVDPRDHALLAFGGAGPMTACFLAEELGMADVVVPTTPGVLSALGGLIADLKNDFIKTVYLDLDNGVAPAIKAEFEALRERGAHWLHHEQGYDGQASFVYSADMRYRGQSFEVETTLDVGAIESGDIDSFTNAFHDAHFKMYSHADREAPVQMINLRLVAVGHAPKPEFTRVRGEREGQMPCRSGEFRSTSGGTPPRRYPSILRERLRNRETASTALRW